MEEYSVRVFPSAQSDIADILEYSGALSPESAVQYFDLFMERLKTLATSPDSRPLAKDTQLRLRGYRTLPVEKYTAFYAIKGKTVELRRVLYAKRQYEGLS